jgi:hypothetical protein
MNLRQLWSIIRGRRTNYRLFGISWTYYPDGDPLGKILMAKTQEQRGDGVAECPDWKDI